MGTGKGSANSVRTTGERTGEWSGPGRGTGVAAADLAVRYAPPCLPMVAAKPPGPMDFMVANAVNLMDLQQHNSYLCLMCHGSSCLVTIKSEATTQVKIHVAYVYGTTAAETAAHAFCHLHLHMFMDKRACKIRLIVCASSLFSCFLLVCRMLALLPCNMNCATSRDAWLTVHWLP